MSMVGVAHAWKPATLYVRSEEDEVLSVLGTAPLGSISRPFSSRRDRFSAAVQDPGPRPQDHSYLQCVQIGMFERRTVNLRWICGSGSCHLLSAMRAELESEARCLKTQVRGHRVASMHPSGRLLARDVRTLNSTRPKLTLSNSPSVDEPAGEFLSPPDDMDSVRPRRRASVTGRDVDSLCSERSPLSSALTRAIRHLILSASESRAGARMARTFSSTHTMARAGMGSLCSDWHRQTPPRRLYGYVVFLPRPSCLHRGERPVLLAAGFQR
ncbi:hypothetical protein C8Q80DRAFT_203997 [Daedaleopsis nitida]|nr:hypothetical protein C8Q80DRAFT_203997 [Daedaleopsis nitida]